MPVDPSLRGGLFKSVVMNVNDIDIVHDARRWAQLSETAEPVGECRGLLPMEREGKTVFVPCDGALFAEPIPHYQIAEDSIWWQEARCNVCGYDVALPNRRKLVHSTRHSEMPADYWTQRMKRMKPTESDI